MAYFSGMSDFELCFLCRAGLWRGVGWKLCQWTRGALPHGDDREMFLYDIGYVYLAGGTEGSKWIYLLAGIGMPLLLQKGIKKIFKKS